MDFNESPEDEAFQQEFRTWLDANQPAGESGEDEWEYRLRWHRRMHSGGWVGIGWAKEYGGRGATLTQQFLYNRELARARKPQLVNTIGIGMVGPTLIRWGTGGQKKRYVPRILSA